MAKEPKKYPEGTEGKWGTKGLPEGSGVGRKLTSEEKDYEFDSDLVEGEDY